MIHTREEVIERTLREFERLDTLVGGLSAADWACPLPRPETKDLWTVKDALAHIAHWKADMIRVIMGRRRPPDVRGLDETAANHLIYLTWRDRTPQEVLDWHRQVQADLTAALRAAPDAWFSGKERRKEWPYDLDGHSLYHRTREIEQVLAARH